TDEATFDVQFGNVTRKTHQNTSWDRARFESCGQKWMDLSEGHYGVSLLNDCKYGHSVKDGCMALTLIKSGIEPNPTTDQEMHSFTYALYPHAENWRAAGTVWEAYKLNQPALCVLNSAKQPPFSLASVDASNVMLETIKQAEDGNGFILRLYETDNALTQAQLQWNGAMSGAKECSLIEEDLSDVPALNNRMAFTIKPYEIKTFRILP
ncbi:MAG: glycoside hydrolase family 38 C-terminal domain-containing protein, partial [Clostridia bacterium]